jgi:hypothetical protein
MPVFQGDGGSEPGADPDGADEQSPPLDDGADDIGDGEEDPGQADAEVDDVVAEREDSPSPWWIVLAVGAGLAALFGLVTSLKRRKREEAWDERAGNVCDAGRTVTGSLRRLDRSMPPASVPEAAIVRLRRFSDQVDVLAETPPHERAERTTVEVGRAIHALRESFEREPPLAGTDAPAPSSAWDDVDRALAATDLALAELEREAMLGAAGASHPSGRPST